MSYKLNLVLNNWSFYVAYFDGEYITSRDLKFYLLWIKLYLNLDIKEGRNLKLMHEGMFFPAVKLFRKVWM